MKTPNANPDMEQALLACVLMNPGILTTLSTTPEHFSIATNRELFAAFDAMRVHDIPIDILNLTDYLERTGRLAKVGGVAYVGKIASSNVYSFNAESYARSLADMADNRHIMTVLNGKSEFFHLEILEHKVPLGCSPNTLGLKTGGHILF